MNEVVTIDLVASLVLGRDVLARLTNQYRGGCALAADRVEQCRLTSSLSLRSSMSTHLINALLSKGLSR